MTPVSVGVPANRMVLGKHSGRTALRSRLHELGYRLSAADLDIAYRAFTELADRKKAIYDQDLINLVAHHQRHEDLISTEPSGAGIRRRPRAGMNGGPAVSRPPRDLLKGNSMTKKLKILIVAGDGIGPEVTGEAVRVLKSVAELGGYDFRVSRRADWRRRHQGARIAATGCDAAGGARERCGAAGRGGEQRVQRAAAEPAAGSWAAEDSRGAGGIREPAAVVCVAGAERKFAAAAGDCRGRGHFVSFASCWAGCILANRDSGTSRQMRRGTRCATRATKWCAWRRWRLSWRKSDGRK